MKSYLNNNILYYYIELYIIKIKLTEFIMLAISLVCWYTFDNLESNDLYSSWSTTIINSINLDLSFWLYGPFKDSMFLFAYIYINIIFKNIYIVLILLKDFTHTFGFIR